MSGMEILLLIICLILFVSFIIVMTRFGILKRKVGESEYVSNRLLRAADIYLAVIDINLKSDTYNLIRSNPTVRGAIGENTKSAQQALYSIMETLPTEEYREALLEFVDFSTLNKRLADSDSKVIEYKGRVSDIYVRARFIVTKRDDAGEVTNVLAMFEDIDDERAVRDDINEYIRTANIQMSSIASIYLSMHDFNIAENIYREIKISDNDVSAMIKGSRDMYKTDMRKILLGTISQIAGDESREDMLKFCDMDTLDERMGHKNTITQEFMSYRGLWSRGRFIVADRSRDGKISRVLWLVESIDEEKRERDELRDMSARAVAASEAKSAFLSNMSHEIRTPINAILGMNEMVLRESKDTNILEYSESINNAGNSLLGIINDILDFSKIEAGKMDIVPVEYDLTRVIKDLVNMIKSRINKKGLEFNLNVDRNIPHLLRGDDVRIKQVITNILTNAAKYTEKGKVDFTVGFEKNDDNSIMLNVSVEDTGVGIREEDMEKLFSEFDRIDLEKNRAVEGTGLGMAITQRLLHLMDSSLNVQSEYGVGSKFSFSVKQEVVNWEALGDYDKAVANIGEERREYRQKFTAPDARVLVVDDTKMNLMVFKNLLKLTQLKIDTATSGDGGIELCLQNKYDLIFLDHMMPEKDGIQTLHELDGISDNPNADTPKICITANAISGARERYIKEGFDDYMSKPIDPGKLEDIIVKYLPEDKVIKGGVSESVAAEDEVKISELLKDVEGIDAEVGLKNSGTESGYRSILNIFYKSIPGNYEEIKGLYDAQDYENYTIKVHALKSQARTVGAVGLGWLAENMEHAGKAKDTEYIIENHDILLKSYIKFEELLKPILEDESDKKEAKDLIKADESKIKEWKEKLMAAALDMDVDILDQVTEEIDDYALNDDDKALFDKVKQKYDRFDYDGIVEVLS